MKFSGSRTTILSGFGLIIFILISIIATFLFHLNKNSSQLTELATLQRAGVLALQMRNAAIQRSLVLFRMAMNSDPFYRDEQAQEFYRIGMQFLLAREEFENIPMSADHRESWETTLENIKLSSKMQAEAVAVLQADMNFSANRKMLEEILPVQKQVIDWMGLILADTQKKNRRPY